MAAEELRNQIESGDNADVISDADSFWSLVHPKVAAVALSRFDSGHYADAIEAALKEVNSEVKAVVLKAIRQELDGASLMQRAFSLENPIIKLSPMITDSEKNIQKGYLQIFSGAMTGIRNPKAHENIVIDKLRAIHFLFLASLLMFKLDEAIK